MALLANSAGGMYVYVADAPDAAAGVALDVSVELLAASRARRMLLEAYIYALMIWILIGLVTGEVAFGAGFSNHHVLGLWSA